jgi:hypothetical protein
VQPVGDQCLVWRFFLQPLDGDIPHHRTIGIGVEHADDLVHPRTAARICRLQGWSVERLIDIARYRARLEEPKSVMLEGRDATERMVLEIPGGNALGGKTSTGTSS